MELYTFLSAKVTNKTELINIFITKCSNLDTYHTAITIFGGFI